MLVKDQQDLVGAFHVDPIYLKHEHQGQVIDYRVGGLFEKMLVIRKKCFLLQNRWGS